MTIRVGIIGLNHGAQVHLPLFKGHAKYEVVAVCARTPGRAEKVAREHNVGMAHTDPRQLIHDRNVDLVSIASPPASHAGYAASALAAGKHALVEIGFVCDAPDARVLSALARERGRVGAAAYVLRFTPLLRHVADLLAAPDSPIGRPRLMRFESFSNFLAEPEPPFGWIWDSKTGGGILWNYTSHAIDLALRWFGRVREVDGILATFTDLARDGVRPRAKTGLLAKVRSAENTRDLADDTGFATLHFENGVLATFSHSAVTAFPRTHMEVHGTQGSLLLEGIGAEASLLRMGAADPEPVFAPANYLEESLGETGLPGGFRVFLDRLAVPIEGGAAPDDLPTFAQGWEVARVLDAIKLASRERRRVRLDEVESGWQVR